MSNAPHAHPDANDGPQRFRVGTFNVYNLLLPGVRVYESDGDSDEVYADKCAWIRQQVQRMQADIVGFQEVFQGRALRDALDGSPLTDVVTRAGPDETLETPNVALASAHEVLQVRYHERIPDHARIDFDGHDLGIDRFSRPVLETKIDVHGLEVDVFVAHLKSKRGVYPKDADFTDPVERAKANARSLLLRAQDAAGLRALVARRVEGPNTPVIVMGDFNDTEAAVTTRMVSGDPPFAKMPFHIKKNIWDTLLYDVQEIQQRHHQRSVHYTHIHSGRFETLDHILVSEEFFPGNKGGLGAVEWVQVLNDHLLDERFVDGEGVPRTQSDHGQVVASIKLHPRHDER